MRNWASLNGVVRDVWAAVALGHAELGEHERHRFGDHRRPAIGMNGELPGGDVLLADRSGSEMPGAVVDIRSNRISSLIHGNCSAGWVIRAVCGDGPPLGARVFV